LDLLLDVKRLTNGRSKKVANHAHMVALYTMYCNFIRNHSKVRMSPATAARIAVSYLSFDNVLGASTPLRYPNRAARTRSARLRFQTEALPA
jgi:hypothetical protein